VRRGLGRGRWLIAGGAIVTIASMPLAWLRVGGVVLSAETASGFEGAGLLVFVACVAMLALIVLPYTMKDRRTALDRPIAYVACWFLAVGGMVSVTARLLGTEGSSLTPGDAPGLWLAITGMAVVTWGLLELLAERPSPP
jgi:low temperature requirement protein LtrA